MAERVSLHRYELLPERRADERRAAERRADERRAAGRRRRERRGRGSLADALAVRRVFPIWEGDAPPGLRERERLQRRSLAAVDAILAVAVVLAVAQLSATAAPSGVGPLAAGVLVVVLAKLAGLYDADDMFLRRSTLDEVPRLINLGGVVAVAYWLALDAGLGRLGVLELWAALAGVLFAGRIVARAGARAVLPPERCLVIGDPVAGEHIRRKIASSRANARVVAAMRLGAAQTAEALGGTEGLRTIVEGDRIDRVLLAPASSDAVDVLELVRVCKLLGVRVSILPRLFEVVGSAVEYENLDGLTLLGVRRFGLPRSSRAAKRAFDLAGSLLGLVAVAPLLVAIAVAIRLDSRGPVLFRQTRVGRDGQWFGIFKFRTMVTGAEQLKSQLLHLNEAGDGMFKLSDDPRTTRVGRFLRATSLDELPQLLNVVRGEMSLVGPRPLAIDEDSRILGLDRGRLHLTPGMTGPWQVLGAARVPMEEMVGIDYLYVANWSLWIDLKLILRTIPHVVTRSGL